MNLYTYQADGVSSWDDGARFPSIGEFAPTVTGTTMSRYCNCACANAHIDMASPNSDAGRPTVVGILLGTQLRRLRKARGITVEVASHAIGASHTKISRMEHGRVRFKAREVADLLTLYGVTDQHQRQTLLTLALQTNAADWAHYYSDLLPSWEATYLGLEQASSVIRTYHPQVIPDLLQTEDVARGLQRSRHPSDCVLDLERRVAVQMTRQEILTDPSAPHLWAVIDQAALWWLAGSPAPGEQIRHLITMAELPHVRLQMLPLSFGGQVAISGPLTILRFADPELPDVVYHQQQTTALCLDSDEDVQHYRALMDNVGACAESPIQTIKHLSALLTNERPQANAAG